MSEFLKQILDFKSGFARLWLVRPFSSFYYVWFHANRPLSLNLNEVFIMESKNTDELKFGDKITEIGGVKVASADEMNVVLKRYKVGDSVTVTVERGGNSISIELTLTATVPDSVNFG